MLYLKKSKKFILRILTIIFAVFLIFGIAHIIYVQCHRAEVVEYLVDKYDFDKKDIVLLDYEGEKFHDDTDLGILFDWYTTPPTWKLRYNKRTFGTRFHLQDGIGCSGFGRGRCINRRDRYL